MSFKQITEQAVQVGLSFLLPMMDGRVVGVYGQRFVEGEVRHELIDAERGERMELPLPGGQVLWAVDHESHYYCYDHRRGLLVKLNHELGQVWAIDWPKDMEITVDSSGHVWGWSFRYRYVAHYDQDGRPVEHIPHSANCYGMAVDAAGRLWLSDTSMQNVLRLDPKTGEQVPVEPWESFAEMGQPGRLFSYPSALVIDSRGNLWAYNADHASNDITVLRLRTNEYLRLRPQDIVATLAPEFPSHECVISPWEARVYLNHADRDAITAHEYELQGWQPLYAQR